MIKIIVPILFALVPSDVFATELRRLPLQELVERSDLIIIGHNCGEKGDDASHSTSESENLIADLVLKGPSVSTLKLLTKSQIIELDVECCEEDIRYVMFLNEAYEGAYASTNGKYGVFQVRGDIVLDWNQESQAASLDSVLREIRELAGQAQK